MSDTNGLDVPEVPVEWRTSELRWVVKPGTTAERPVLQQKWAIGRDERFGEHTEWRDVPVASE